MKATRSFETSVRTRATRRNIPKEVRHRFCAVLQIEVLAVVVMNTSVSRDIKLRILLRVNRRFGGTYLLATCFYIDFLLGLFFNMFLQNNLLTFKK
jgi:hypothetical protein